MFAVSQCAAWVQAQPASAHTAAVHLLLSIAKKFLFLICTLIFNEFSNAGTYTFVRCILVCGLCAGLTCAAHAAAEHLLLSIATKVGKNAFAAVSRRLAKTESYYQRKVNFLPHARRRQFRSFILSPSKCKRSTTIHIFFLAVGLLGLAFANSRRQLGGL